MIRIGFKTRKKTLSLYERKDREIICMLNEKSGKMIVFWGWDLESLLQRHVAFKGHEVLFV